MKKGIKLCSGHKIFFAVSKRSHRGNFSVKNAEKMLGSQVILRVSRFTKNKDFLSLI